MQVIREFSQPSTRVTQIPIVLTQMVLPSCKLYTHSSSTIRFAHMDQSQYSTMPKMPSLMPHPVPNAPTSVITDDSDILFCSSTLMYSGVTLSLFSRALKPAETRYSTYDRELLAIHLAIKELEGRHFHVLTDHKPLSRFAPITIHLDKSISSVSSSLTSAMCKAQPTQQQMHFPSWHQFPPN